MNDIVLDINKALEKISLGQLEISEEAIEQFGEDIKQSLRDWSVPREDKGFTLRFSNVGKPLRKLWYEKRNPSNNPIAPALSLKFLYGHMLEHLVVLLVKLSGNTVTDQQKEVNVEEVKEKLIRHFSNLFEAEIKVGSYLS